MLSNIGSTFLIGSIHFLRFGPPALSPTNRHAALGLYRSGELLLKLACPVVMIAHCLNFGPTRPSAASIDARPGTPWLANKSPLK
ncbi:hypothetical protein [Jiella flava]|uniref:Uncharacterized protein n=1 Tax=Jiella flava TaxID=2816857 RepID=A0A939FTH7_9HYPH|nr:hypothetical protein [Jiella flava]MBO0661110.1 hypothetical protein [Jiella flava]